MVSAADPRCPACGEPVGERALYCMHCGADFGDEGAEAAGGERHDGTDSAAADDGPGEHGDLLDRLFHPEGFLDDSLTVVLGVAVGLVCGVVALTVVGASAGGTPGLLAALIAWIGVTGWLARQYSLFGAVRGGCYALAVALLALPVVGLTDAAQGGTFGGRVLLFLVGEVVFGLLALPLVGIGYAAGRRRPDPDASGAGGRTAAEE